MRRVRELPIPRPSIANPQVTPELDHIVMTALERDPKRRWQSASSMLEHLKTVIALFPGNLTDKRGVADWIAWAFDQKRGRPPQLTPMFAMPVRQELAEEATVVMETVELEPSTVDPASIVSLPFDARWRLPFPIWRACAVALIAFTLVSFVLVAIGC
jgi:hypothetical protein